MQPKHKPFRKLASRNPLVIPTRQRKSGPHKDRRRLLQERNRRKDTDEHKQPTPVPNR